MYESLFCSMTGDYRELLIELKVLPTVGPSRRIMAITTRATNTMMIAYSTSPCPCSLIENNMDEFLSEKTFDFQRWKIHMIILSFSSHFVPKNFARLCSQNNLKLCLDNSIEYNPSHAETYL